MPGTHNYVLKQPFNSAVWTVYLMAELGALN